MKKPVVWIVIAVLVAGVAVGGYLLNESNKKREARRNWDLMRTAIDGALAGEMYRTVARAAADGKPENTTVRMIGELVDSNGRRKVLGVEPTSGVDDLLDVLFKDRAWLDFTIEQWAEIDLLIARISYNLGEQADHLRAGGSVDDQHFRFLRDEEAEKCAEIMGRIRSVSK